MFAEALKTRFPFLPIEEEGRLADPRIRDNFVERVFAYRPRAEIEARYTEGFMTALTIIATPRRHTNVLQHMAGYFKTQLDPASRAELAAAIDDYRLGLVPLIVPITLLRHHVRQHDMSYLARQVYLDPHPKELMLRNHV